MQNNTRIITGSARIMKVEEINVGFDESRIEQVAAAATTVIMQKFGNSLGATQDEVNDVNVIGLKVALARAIDPEAKVARGLYVPCYFDSMTKGMMCTIGRTTVKPTSMCMEVVVPEHYSTTVIKLKAAGLYFVNPHRPATEKSQTLALSKENIDGVATIVGNLGEVSIDDIIRRALIEVEEKSEATLRRLAGELTYQYGELDVLLPDYFIAETKVALG